MAVWYSYRGIPYKGDRPAFYDIRDFAWGDHLLANHEKIKTLALEFLGKKEIIREQYFNKELVEGKSKWELTTFLFWGRESETNIATGKELYAIFSGIKGLVGLSISILPPQTSIKPHYGDTDAVTRVHIPVLVPGGLPQCGIRIDGQNRAWENIIVFCDAHLHEAWNHTDSHRLVVIADIVHHDLAGKEKTVCNNVLSLLRLQSFLNRNKAMNHLPGPLKGALRYWFKFCIFTGM